MKFMMKLLKSLLAALLIILSTESKSMEIQPEKSQCAACGCHSTKQAQVEEGYQYLPLFRVSNREQKFSVFYFWIVIEMPDNQVPLLTAFKDFQFNYSTAYAYLKISDLAIKELNNIAVGKVPEGIEVADFLQIQSLKSKNSRKKILKELSPELILKGLKFLEEGTFAVAFETQLSATTSLLSPYWTVKMNTKPMSIYRETCKCVSKGLKENLIEDGKFEACEITSFLNLDPFDLETEKGKIPGTKLFMYPKFDFVESFHHIKDIRLIHLAGMVYINNTYLQALPMEITGLIIETYFSIVQSEFNRTGKLVYQSELKNIENFAKI